MYRLLLSIKRTFIYNISRFPKDGYRAELHTLIVYQKCLLFFQKSSEGVDLIVNIVMVKNENDARISKDFS